MYITVRKYEGVVNPEEASKRIEQGFVLLISGLPGFVNYVWADLGEGSLLSVSVFENQARASESNRLTAGWVELNLRSVLPNPCQVEKGSVTAHKSSRKTRA